MNEIRRFFKRLRWNYLLQGKTKAELVNLLKTHDSDVADLIWWAYLRQVENIPELMVIVYDDHHEFPKVTRLIAGWSVLEKLRSVIDCLLFLPGSDWGSLEHGRLAYLQGVGLYLPELRPKAEYIVRRYFLPYEQSAFDEGCW